MPPFWFGLIAIHFFAHHVARTVAAHEPFVPVHLGLHGQHGPGSCRPVRLRPPPVPAGADPDGPDRRRVEPLPAVVDARRAVVRLHPDGPGQGRCPRWKVIVKHALRNALIPLVTVMAIDIGALFGGLDHHRADLLHPRHGHAVPRRPAERRHQRAAALADGHGHLHHPVQPAGRRPVRRRSTRGSGCHEDQRDLGDRGEGRWSSARPADAGARRERQVLVPGAREPPARSQWQLFLPPFPPPQAGRRVAASSCVVLYLARQLPPQTTAPYPLNPTALAAARPGPSAKHWFGTDELGRDQLTRHHLRRRTLADHRPAGGHLLDGDRHAHRRRRRLFRRAGSTSC